MSVRSLSIVALVIVTGSATGCGGMKNFLFGRGAQCGLCNRIGAVGNAINPLAAAPGVMPANGTCNSPRGGCNLFNRNPAPVYAPPVAYAPTETCSGGCGNGGYSMGMAGDCESCHSYSGGYHEGVVGDSYINDPYLGSPVMGSEYPVESYPSGGYQGGSIQGDGFYQRPTQTYGNQNFGTQPYGARKFDSRGDEIISESPLPPNAQLIN